MDGKALELLKKEFNVKDDPETLHKFSVDYGIMSPVIEKKRKLPSAVVFLRREDEVERLMEIVSDFKVRVVERGKGTNTLGGAIPLTEESIVVDLSGMKGFSINKQEIVSSPGTQFEEVGVEEFPLVPTSFYMATIGGFVSGGSLGLGSLRNGAVWDNVKEVTVYTPRGKVSLSGDDVKSVVQAGGTNGVVTRVKIRRIRRGKLGVKRTPFNSIDKAIDFALDHEDAELVSIRNDKMMRAMGYESVGKWNVIVGEEEGDGEEVPFRELITNFAGAYYTVVNKLKVKYSSVDLPLYKLYELPSNCMVDAELSRSQGIMFSHTYFLDCDPSLNGYKFDLHSVLINDRVESNRLSMMINFKRNYDPEDLMNPGKLIFQDG
ncbi:FAD-binding oxidoreductase [Sulfuracidifex metallicus]|uniref:FAD-binding protein n=2 Tax=Sulfuracidifex metallicus TaxID=47303 RepID=A0A6A9QJG2_SULME|nr:FAD-binding oxidoreductase [Sulfuracidifex metallicus]MUN29136.1 FAD-binding protein [Sulfuracidifex metallicus DSM 6482 = JCM 9184]WOE50342.1 FAD-binding oxidoreductase [Sulfuracidifex metallicus DSM 6482 = JCM 9184]